MQRTGSAHWQGGLKDGRGTVSTQSGVLTDTPYGFRTRFESTPGTNPEELIAAAHAGCFSMALSAELGHAGLVPEDIQTTAVVTLDRVEGSFSITAVALTLRARIPGARREVFEAVADKAKQSCPVSKVLNAHITLEATLES